MLFGNLNNLDFIRPTFSSAWSRNSWAMHWILKFSDNLFPLPDLGQHQGVSRMETMGKLAALTPSLRRPWRGEMGISSDLSAARPGTGIVVRVTFTEAHSVQSAAPGSTHLVSGFGNPGREGSCCLLPHSGRGAWLGVPQ